MKSREALNKAMVEQDAYAPLYSWRVLATALGFGLFGLGGLILSVLVFPVLYLLPIGKHKTKRLSRLIMSRSLQLYVAILTLLGLIRLEVRGHENLASSGQLIVANHPSLLDVVYLISLIDNTTCLFKNTLRYNPFTAGTVLATGYIPNNSGQLIEDCANALTAGDSLIIFPEGTRTRPNQPLKFHRGAANIAIMAAKDITPVRITSNPPGLIKNQPWYRASRFRLHITIEAFPAIAIKPYLESEAIRAKMARRISADLEAFYHPMEAAS